MLEVIHRQPQTPRGVPLLFVHGIMHGAWCYDEFFLPWFAQRGYPSYALSLRGHGGSPLKGSLRWVPVADYVADVITVMEQIRADTGQMPVLIGHSMGGLIVQKTLETHAAAGAVLLAAVPVSTGLLALLRAMRRYPLYVLASPLTFQPILRDASIIRWLFFAADMPDEILERYRSRLTAESFRAILDLALLYRPHPARMHRVPVLVINGQNDTLFTISEGQRTADAYEGVYHVVDNAAHDIMLDATWQQSAEHIAHWLETHLT